MAGLLDFLNTAEAQTGLGLLAAGGARSDGANFGQRLLEGLSQGDRWKAQQAAAKRAEMQDQFQQMQMAHATRQAAMEQAAMEQSARKREALPGLWTGGSQALSPLMGDPATGILPSAGRAAVPGAFDVQKALKLGYTPEEITKLDALRNIGQNEVARTIKGMQGGREVEQQVDKFGRPVGQGFEQFRAPIEMALGDKKQLLDPYTRQPVASFAMGQSPDSKASNALGWANNALSRQRFAFDQTQGDKPQYVAELGMFVNPRTQTAMPIRDTSGNLVESSGGKMTEDQAKASGWLVQAENAYKNMKAATKANPDAAKPGFNDAFAAIPSFGITNGIANTMRGAERQKYMQGASSLSESLLRAATGAGVNQDEALQKVRELTPQIGDDDATIAQKEAAIPLYIESLKVRAGPGAKKVSGILQSTGGQGFGGSTTDPLGIRGR